MLFFITKFSLCATKDEQKAYLFPNDFRWCVATSAHQIEGYNDKSDWWSWEQQGKVVNNETSGRATDHWNKVDLDINLLKRLNIKSYRLSFEWAKIEPTQGRWDIDAVEHYKNEIKLLIDNKIEPLITLQHFTLPKWVQDRGGWEWKELPLHFEKYVSYIYSEIGIPNRVANWITINEPTIFLMAGYVGGVFPPGKTNSLNQLKDPIVSILKSHAKAYKILHKLAEKNNLKVFVGMAHALRVFDPLRSWNPLDLFLAKSLDNTFNWAFVLALENGVLSMKIPFAINIEIENEEVRQTQDFIGINYYNHDLVGFQFSPPYYRFEMTPGAKINDLGWEIYPKGIYRILKEVSRKIPNRDILITENGIADAKDNLRKDYIEDHLIWIHKAMTEGAKVRGYCHWSLLDNFEWDKGWSPRFGLYEVNYLTLERSPRASAIWYSEVSSQNVFYSSKEITDESSP